MARASAFTMYVPNNPQLNNTYYPAFRNYILGRPSQTALYPYAHTIPYAQKQRLRQRFLSEKRRMEKRRIPLKFRSLFKKPLPKPQKKPNYVGSLLERAAYTYWDPAFGGVPPAQRPGEKYLRVFAGVNNSKQPIYKFVNEYNAAQRARQAINRNRLEYERALHANRAYRNAAARKIQTAWRTISRIQNEKNMKAVRKLLSNLNKRLIGTGRTGGEFNKYKQLRKNLNNGVVSNNVRRALNEYRRTGNVKFYAI